MLVGDRSRAGGRTRRVGRAGHRRVRRATCSTSKATAGAIPAASSTPIPGSRHRSRASSRGRLPVHRARGPSRCVPRGRGKPARCWTTGSTRSWRCAAELHIATGAGERLVRVEHGGAYAGDEVARACAEQIIEHGGTGMISGCTHEPELTALGTGFYANSGSGGASSVAVPAVSDCPRFASRAACCRGWSSRRARDLHVRLLYSHVSSRRLVASAPRAQTRPGPVPKPSVVASTSRRCGLAGTRRRRRRRRRTRRIAGGVLAVAGLVNLLSAITPPLKRAPRHAAPTSYPSACTRPRRRSSPPPVSRCCYSAGACAAGQRHAWVLAVAVTALSSVLHIVQGPRRRRGHGRARGPRYLLVKRRNFTPWPTDRPSAAGAVDARGRRRRGVGRGTVTALVVPGHRHTCRSGAPSRRSRSGWSAIDRHRHSRAARSLPHADARRCLGLALAVTAGWMAAPARRRRRRLTSSTESDARPRHRATVRRRHARLLRAARRQAVLLLGRHRRRLRRAQRRVPGVARPDRAGRRAGRGVAAPSGASPTSTAGPSPCSAPARTWLPIYRASGHARPVRRRRGRRRRAAASPSTAAACKGAAPGRQPRRQVRLHASSSTTRPGSRRAERRAARADDREPAGRGRAGLLDDARPRLRPRGRPACCWPCASDADGEPAAFCQYVPAAGHRRLLARPDAPPTPASTPTGSPTS